MAAGVGSIDEPNSLKVTQLKLMDGMEGRGSWYWEGSIDVNAIQVGIYNPSFLI